MKGHIVFVDWETKYWKISILSKSMYWCNAVPIKMPVGLVFWKADSKTYLKIPEANNTQDVLNKNKKVGSLLDIKFYYKVTIMKIMCHWHNVRHNRVFRNDTWFVKVNTVEQWKNNLQWMVLGQVDTHIKIWKWIPN